MYKNLYTNSILKLNSTKCIKLRHKTIPKLARNIRIKILDINHSGSIRTKISNSSQQ